MKILFLAAFVLLMTLNGTSRQTNATRSGSSEAEVAAITRFYGAWSEALATRGAEGYVSFFLENGAVLPPDGPAVEGKDAIRSWIQKTLDDFTTRDTRLVPGAMTVSDGMATWRFTISGERVPKKGGNPVRFSNKYLDVLKKQPDGSWKFLYRMWSNNEPVAK